MALTKDTVIEVAKSCYDPEIPVNIWDLGLLYDIEVLPESKEVRIKMTLTTQACPMAKQIPQMLHEKLLTDPEIEDVQIEMVFDPPWSAERITEEGKKRLGIEA